MKRLLLIAVSTAAAMLLAGLRMDAKVSVPSIISDNMVLQQQTDAALWGTAKPGSKVVIRTSWDKRKTTVTADKESGRWSARVRTPEAGGPYEITISDGEKLTLRNILIGEVWFCSGQSNMEMPVKGFDSQPVENSAETIFKARKSTLIRMCTVQRNSSTVPVDSSKGSWQEHTPEAVANTSACAYYFAQALNDALDIPIGILISDWGGSSIETWLSEEVFEKQFPTVDLGHLHGTKPVTHKYQNPCLLFNGMVNPLIPYTFKGMLWYQGETNRGHAKEYIAYQNAYIEMMRTLFQAPDAPFYCVQIAPYKYGRPNNFESGYFVEAQQKSVESMENCGMVVTCDIGDFGLIHPRKKKEVGYRLAMLALEHDYGYSFLEADAPVYKSVEFREGKAYVKFDSGKETVGPRNTPLGGFEIAGEDKVFHPAKAEVWKEDLRAIVVSSPDVPEPAAVRYCFRNWSVGTVYNNSGIPLAPFRTDDWNISE